MDNLCFIKPKNGIKQKDKRQKIKNAVVQKITTIDKIGQFRSNGLVDHELVLMVCNCVENVIKKNAGIDKKELVVEIFKQLFADLSAQETENIKNQCQYSYDNNLIEKIPVIYKAGSILYNYIKSKL